MIFKLRDFRRHINRPNSNSVQIVRHKWKPSDLIKRRDYKPVKHDSVQLRDLVDWLKPLVASVLNSLLVNLIFLRRKVRLVTSSVLLHSSKLMPSVRHYKIRRSMA